MGYLWFKSSTDRRLRGNMKRKGPRFLGMYIIYRINTTGLAKAEKKAPLAFIDLGNPEAVQTACVQLCSLWWVHGVLGATAEGQCNLSGVFNA